MYQTFDEMSGGKKKKKKKLKQALLVSGYSADAHHHGRRIHVRDYYGPVDRQLSRRKAVGSASDRQHYVGDSHCIMALFRYTCKLEFFHSFRHINF
jgi:hypothetical protein